MVVAEQSVLPPSVLDQQKAIDAALDLAAGWFEAAGRLQKTADYTRIHGASMVADRYAVRARALAANAQALREALDIGNPR
jgi:hypothetical protein